MIKTEFMELYEELSELNEATQKQYKITYREDGVSKSFTVLASSKAEAEQKAWSKVDADSVWVTELEEELTEAKRIISHPDILYHATEAENLYKILSEDTLKGSINTRANINAVCLTTDINYTIYQYPCKLQFSRKLLTEGGYEFIPYDEFADDTKGRGESEERILGDITEVSKYLTAVHLNWDQIAIAKSIQPGAEGNYISGPRYDKHNNEDEAWDLRYEDFIAVLKKLQASGVYILQEGKKTYRYWIDENGKPHAGKMPTTPPVAV